MVATTKAVSRSRSLISATAALVGSGVLSYRTRANWAVGVVAFVFALWLLAVFLPRAYGPVQRALDAVVQAILAVITVVLLGAVYFLVFVPIRIGLGLARRDWLERRWNPQASSYWKSPAAASPAAHYDRQF